MKTGQKQARGKKRGPGIKGKVFERRGESTSEQDCVGGNEREKGIKKQRS